MNRRINCVLFLVLAAFATPAVAQETPEATTPRTVEALIADLKDPTAETRFQAIIELASRGSDAEPAVPLLVEALRDSNDRVRIVAAMCLGELTLQPQTVMPALLAAMDDTTSVDERPMYVVTGLALGSYGPPALPLLRQALASEKLTLRRGALAGLYRVGPPAQEALPELIELLKEQDLQLRSFLYQALMGIGPGAAEAVPVLIERLSSEDFHTQYWACRALGAIGPQALPARDKLMELIQSDVPAGQQTVAASVRHNAATALADIGPQIGPEGVQVLIGALSDYSQIVRQKAVIALGKLQPLSNVAADKIEQMLREPSKFSPRAEAAKVLHAMQPESEDLVIQALLQDLIASAEPDVAARVLAEIEFQSDIVPRLIPLLQSEQRYVRQYAVIALGNLGPDAAAAEQALTPLLQDDAEEVRKDAELALQKIKGAPGN
jgi:HEAT repeat protein